MPNCPHVHIAKRTHASNNGKTLEGNNSPKETHCRRRPEAARRECRPCRKNDIKHVSVFTQVQLSY